MFHKVYSHHLIRGAPAIFCAVSLFLSLVQPQPSAASPNLSTADVAGQCAQIPAETLAAIIGGASVSTEPQKGALSLPGTFDARDPSQPELILPEPNTSYFQVDPTWDVVQADYHYGYVTLGDSIINQQRLTRLSSAPDADYQRDCGTKRIKAAGVKALVLALKRLVESQSELTYADHTDDYPRFTVELLGLDGRRLTISSSSNSNPGYAPWNIVYNGRIYASFDRRFWDALVTVFDIARGTPTATTGVSGLVPIKLGQVGFTSTGFPSGNNLEIDGLSLLSGGLFSGPRIMSDLAAGTLRLHVAGQVAISSYRNPDAKIVGNYPDLRAMVIGLPGQRVQDCPLAPKENGQPPEPLVSTFLCTFSGADKPTAGMRYRYPVRIEGRDTVGNSVTFTGVVVGVWGELLAAAWTPVPGYLQQMLDNQPAVTAAIAGYKLRSINLEGSVDPQQPDKPSAAGLMDLWSDLPVDGMATKVPLRIQLLLRIEDGRVIDWRVSAAALKATVDAMMKIPFMPRALKAIAQPALALDYESPYRRGAVGCDGSVYTNATPTQPLPIIRFPPGGDAWSPWPRPQIALTKGGPVVQEISISFAKFALDDPDRVFMPAPFDRLPPGPLGLNYSTNAFGDSPSTRLSVYIAEGASADEIARLTKFVETLPFSSALTAFKDRPNKTWESDTVRPMFEADGTLAFKACAPVMK